MNVVQGNVRLLVVDIRQHIFLKVGSPPFLLTSGTGSWYWVSNIIISYEQNFFDKYSIGPDILIELKEVSKYYGDEQAVAGLSFCVEEGETFGLIGTSGCGKTTTLKMINRLEEPTSGTIKIDGEEHTARSPEQLRRRIGYVIQDVGLFPHYSVRENVETVPRLLRWDDERIRSRSNDLLQLVGLNPDTFAGRRPEALSGGQQQRVGLARALAADPSIILMDEPFGALDPITKRQIRKEVSSIFERLNKTIVLVTHDIFEAFEMCDRLCLLDDGVLQQTGTPKELLFQPSNTFVNSFFTSDRFQLELLSISLKDITGREEEETELYWSPPLTDHDRNIDPAASLYAILEKMQSEGSENTAIIRRVSGKVTDSLGFTDLLSRFQQHKRSLKSGGDDG